MLRRVNEQDVARLYREYGYLVFRRCVVYLGDVTAARECTRDVFVRALRNPTSLRAFADSRTWLCRVADALCIEALQRRHNRAPPDDPAFVEAIADDDLESLLLVRRLLANLDSDSLRLAVLFYVDELTEEELAEELGLSRRTVAKRVTALLEHARASSVRQSAS
jgi:RNA polymerase sigma-70 factor (ECF subfamily)